MIGDRFYLTLIQGADGIHWDLRSGHPDETNVRIEDGLSATWAGATYRAGQALHERAERRS
jgi:hypothetical protein